MENDPREFRSEGIVLALDPPTEGDVLLGAALWLTGSLFLLLWTGLVLVLTSA